MTGQTISVSGGLDDARLSRRSGIHTHFPENIERGNHAGTYKDILYEVGTNAVRITIIVRGYNAFRVRRPELIGHSFGRTKRGP